jgi:hypothetical protein
LATIRSVQSSRAAISVSLSPAAASSTGLARITWRYGAWSASPAGAAHAPAASVIIQGLGRHLPEIRHGHGNAFNRREHVSGSRY